MLLAFMATSGVLGWLNIRWLDCSIGLPDEIYSGIPTLVTVRLNNRKPRLPSFLLQIKLYGKECRLTMVESGATETTSFPHTFHGRGEHPAEAAVVSSAFPVNFFVRGMALEIERKPLVFPAPSPAKIGTFTPKSGPSGEIQHPDRGLEGDLLTISDYTGAEPLKLIHWRLSARHDWFKVKELGTAVVEPVIVDITSATSVPIEESLSQAAFLVNRLFRSNRPIGLKLAANRVIPAAVGRAHRLRLLTELALYDPTGSTP